MAAYYNEIDPKTAAWLRELIKAGLIADGEVDTRSIVDVSAGDVRGFTQCHFFAGIGGWSYALRIAGWPDDYHVWTGSCPCQPWSMAGHSNGAADSRDLWYAWFRLVRECRPGVVFGEQVDSSAGRAWLDRVCADVEHVEYAIGAAGLPAASVGAPHARARLWFVANTLRPRLPKRHERGVPRETEVPLAWREFERVHAARDWKAWQAKSAIPVFVDGVSERVGQVRGFGNAIVPEVAAAFIEAYMTCGEA